jgi:hypothetical protein
MESGVEERLRVLLVELGVHLRDVVMAGREGAAGADLRAVAGSGGGDTIYGIDKIGEVAVLEWFERRWPADLPVKLVMEGIEEEVVFPRGVGETRWTCILDPIDGTRGLMYDKRAAWVLCGVAPRRGGVAMLSDMVAASMTEIPTTRQWRAERYSATAGGELVAEWDDVRGGGGGVCEVRPSSAGDFRHGFASLVKFFPEGRELTARIEERLWGELVGLGSCASPEVFDDQYLSTGGQMAELMRGHDRMVGDVRPLVLRVLGLGESLVCHPYDFCAWLVAAKAGVVFQHPLGGFPDAPLDTCSGVCWVAYANGELARVAAPVLKRVLEECAG